MEFPSDERKIRRYLKHRLRATPSDNRNNQHNFSRLQTHYRSSLDDYKPLIPSNSPLIPNTSPLFPNTSPLIPNTSPLIPNTSPLIPNTSPLFPNTSPLIPNTTNISSRTSLTDVARIGDVTLSSVDNLITSNGATKDVCVPRDYDSDIDFLLQEDDGRVDGQIGSMTFNRKNDSLLKKRSHFYVPKEDEKSSFYIPKRCDATGYDDVITKQSAISGTNTKVNNDDITSLIPDSYLLKPNPFSGNSPGLEDEDRGACSRADVIKPVTLATAKKAEREIHRDDVISLCADDKVERKDRNVVAQTGTSVFRHEITEEDSEIVNDPFAKEQPDSGPLIPAIDGAKERTSDKRRRKSSKKKPDEVAATLKCNVQDDIHQNVQQDIRLDTSQSEEICEKKALNWKVCIRVEDYTQQLSKTTMARYVYDATEFKLNDNIIEIVLIDPAAGKAVISVSCPTEELQRNFLEAVIEAGLSACAMQQSIAKTTVDRPIETPTERKLTTAQVRISFKDDGLQHMKVEKDTVADFIFNVTGIQVAEEDLEEDWMNDAAGDSRAFLMTLHRKDADEYTKTIVSAINEVSMETGMSAASLTAADLEMKRLWDDIFSQATSQFEEHHKKLSEVSAELKTIEDGNKTKSKRGISLAEYEKKQAKVKPLESKHEELQNQEIEFSEYVDKIQKAVCNLRDDQDIRKEVDRLRFEFGLELKKFSSALPMYAKRKEIVDTVRSNRVSIVLGETGSGKSTQILQYLHDAGFTKDGLIVCTQPRKVAAVSLANRVAQEMGGKVGQLVGYQVGMQVKRSNITKMLYVTDHILLNDCLKDPLFTKYACVVIDEAHERSIYTDILLGFIKRSLCRRDDLKVIITSATIDPDIFVRYFGGTPPVVQVSGRVFPVEEVYERCAEVDYVSAAVEKALWVNENMEQGDVLVFLTSPLETEKACKILRSSCGDQRVWVLELNGRLQLEDQQKVFQPTPSGKRKIVFATNSAETSVTIPGIKYVIDTGKIREMSFDPKKNMSVLSLTWTTKSSANQRKGRAGRTDSGVCYRLYTREDYDSMRTNSVPEILRIHLGQALLKLLMLGIKDPLKFEFVESPQAEAIKEALALLEELGAYDIEVGITEIGKQLSQIAVEPRLGKVVLCGVQEGIGYEAMIIAAISSAGGSVFFRGGSEEAKKESDRTKTRFCDEWGDMITGAMIYKEWEGLPTSNRGNWCRINNINGKTMKTTQDLLKEIMHVFLNDLHMVVAKRFSDDAKLNEKLAKILLDCYPSNLARFLGHERIGYCLAKNPKETMRLHPSSSLLYLAQPSKWVVYEQMVSTTNVFMTNVTYVDESWLAERLTTGKLKVNMTQLEEELLVPRKFSGLGKHCISKLLEKKAQALKDLEDGIKQASGYDNPRLFIQLDKNKRCLELYVEREIKTIACLKVQFFLDDVRKPLTVETLEGRIRKSSTVRFVLGSGLQVRSILMPGEQRQVKVYCYHQRDSSEMERICKVLSAYGEIESSAIMPQHSDRNNSQVFGNVKFKNAKDAEAAVRNHSSMSDGFRIEFAMGDTSGSRSKSANFSVKVEVCRRPLAGRGHIQFHDSQSVGFVLQLVSYLNVQRQFRNGVSPTAVIHLSQDRRNDCHLYMRNIPEWATKDIVKRALTDAIPSLSQDVLDVALFRKESPSPADSQRRFHYFREQIMQVLRESDNFEVQMNEPKHKDFTMFACLKFEDPDKAADAAAKLDGLVSIDQCIEARLELKTTFIVSAFVYGSCKGDVEQEVRLMNENSVGPIHVEMKRRDNGSFIINVETEEIEVLREAKTRLDEVIYGHRLNLTDGNYFKFKSDDARKRLDEIQRLAEVRVRLDDRQEVVFIYGRRDSVTVAKQLIAEYFDKVEAKVNKEISLRDGGYPRGITKALVSQFGSNLEKLRAASGTFELELVLKRHVIRFRGTEESYNQLKALIDKTAEQLPEPRLEVETTPECPVCLGNVDYDECYVTEYCGHFYCKDCARNLVRNGLSNNTIPIQCVVEDCGKDLVLRDFQNLLPSLDETFDSAIRSFVATSNKEYAFCLTPDCPMIYRKAKEQSEEFVCSGCHVSLCTRCDASFHPGVTCEVFGSFSVKADDEIKVWLQGDPEGRALCPKCGIPIEKNGGCNRMECRECKAHICWKCKEYFADSGSCYSHLTSEHGGCFDYQ